jgi:hypothetical protein
MTNHAALIARLCEASEGSADLSVEVWDALTPHTHIAHTHVDHNVFATVARYVGDGDLMGVDCLTTSLSAAWEEAERRGHSVLCTTHWHGEGKRSYTVLLGLGKATGKDKSCTLCAAILAAEGER